jgi:hypothetical protein
VLSHISARFYIYPRDSAEPQNLDSRLPDGGQTLASGYIARFQIDKVRSNGYTVARGSLSSPSPDAMARHIRLAQELTVFAPVRRDVALRYGEFSDTLTIEPFTAAAYWVTPFIQDPLAYPSWVGATVEDGHVILRWKPRREPFFYSSAVYVMRGSEPAELLSLVPLRAEVWADTAPPQRMRTYGDPPSAYLES